VTHVILKVKEIDKHLSISIYVNTCKTSAEVSIVQ